MVIFRYNGGWGWVLEWKRVDYVKVCILNSKIFNLFFCLVFRILVVSVIVYFNLGERLE